MTTAFAPRVPTRAVARGKKKRVEKGEKKRRKRGKERQRAGGSGTTAASRGWSVGGQVRASFSHYPKFFRPRWLA